MKKNIIAFTLVCLSLLSSCNLDFYPNEKFTDEGLKSDSSGVIYVTYGNYASFKDVFEYGGTEMSGNTFVRHFFQMTEFLGDNVNLSGRTTDPLYEAHTYTRTADISNATYLWWVSYKILNGANSVIESITEGDDSELDHIKGENYFMRAYVHLQLLNLWAKPYSHGRDNLGVILRTKTGDSTTVRASVGEVYDQIVADLIEAARLMSSSSRRGNAGYISKLTAQGLLSRVYLYMEQNDDVISIVDEMLGGAAASSMLEPTSSYESYYINALNSTETLWAVAHTATETMGGSSIASMYLTDGQGWGEMYASDTYLNLIERYQEDDLRYSFIKPYYTESGKYFVRWATADIDSFYVNTTKEVTFDSASNKYYFVDGTETIYVETKTVDTYDQYYITYGGEEIDVRLEPEMKDRFGYPMYYMTKFSYQDDDPMLSSPVMLRWGEVILNRAEAYAKKGSTALALADVNTIRERAGLSGEQLFASATDHGYTDILDIVLDERRLELSFEGHRPYDIYRNKLSLDRRFTGVQTWEVIDCNDTRIQYLIPNDEVTVSGIEQNP